MNEASPSVTLVLGGARSGKSGHAEALVRAMAGSERPLYIATAEAGDAEMAARIAAHRARRAEAWETHEVPLDLAAALRAHARPGRAILVDCLTLWLSNLMLAGRVPERERRTFLEALASTQGHVVLVSNEVGLGLVPETALGRAFRDEAGRLNQNVAAAAARVIFMAAGLPLYLKGGPPQVH